MAKALSIDLRRRVVDAIEQGLSCRQAAVRFGISASSAIRWCGRLKKQGDLAAKRQGGDRKSGRIEAEAAFLLGEVAKTPDITLVELQEKLKVRGVIRLAIGAFKPSECQNYFVAAGYDAT